MRYSPSALVLATLILTGGLASSLSAQTTVYANDFSANANGFSTPTLSTTPGTPSHSADKFLGEFNNLTDTLTLTGLAAHTSATLTFDVYFLRSWDGNAQFGGGPGDGFAVTANGTTLLNSNFANYPGNTQQFQSQAAPNAGGQAPYTGSAEQNTLGYTFSGTPMDAVYHFSYAFNTATPILALAFAGTPNEDISNESWGLDNVLVTTNAVPAAVPEPGSIALLMGMGVTGTILLQRRKAAHKPA